MTGTASSSVPAATEPGDVCKWVALANTTAAVFMRQLDGKRRNRGIGPVPGPRKNARLSCVSLST